MKWLSSGFGAVFAAVIALGPAILSGCDAVEPGSKPRPAPESASGPVRLRVMTYNMFIGVRDVKATVAAIRAGKAGLVCLQEATRRWESHLRPALKAEYPHMTFRILEENRGVGVLSRYPFEEIAWVPSPLGWNYCQAIAVDLDGRKIQVLVVHLKPPFVDRKFRLSLRAALTTGSKHLVEIKDAYRHLRTDQPTLVLGDFNEGRRGAAVRWLTDERGLRDAVTPFDARTPSWHQDMGFAHPCARIDHILYSSHFVSEAGRVHQVGPSDHFPVTADLRLVR